MKILTFIHFYLPGYKSGGPLKTIENMVEQLDMLDFLIVTSDRDLGDSVPYEGIRMNAWNKIGYSTVFYVSGANSKIGKFLKFIKLIKETEYDVVYFNSFFDAIFTFLPLLALNFFVPNKKPIIIAPRGEFSAGAISLKRWKKVPYLYIIAKLGLLKNVTWHASTENEVRDIKHIYGKYDAAVRNGNNIRIAADVSPPPPAVVHQKPDNPVFKIIFLSRISPKKNLAYLLSCLAKVATPIQFNIYGPVEDRAYWSECQALMAALPAHIEATYCGPRTPSEVPALMREHDLFFFPTLGENYGHVIIESLSAGTPVLISDQTPWTSDADGACITLPLKNQQQFVTAIDEHAKKNYTTRRHISNAALKLAVTFTNNELTLQDNLNLFQHANAA